MTLATSSCTTSELLDLQHGICRFCARTDASHHELACHICELIGQRSAAASTGGATKVGIAGQGGSHLRASLRTRPHLLAQRLAQHLVVHGGARGRCGALAGIVRSQGGLGAAAAAARSIVSRGQPAVPRRLPAVVFSSCSPGESLTTRRYTRAHDTFAPHPAVPARGLGAAAKLRALRSRAGCVQSCGSVCRRYRYRRRGR